MSCNLCPTENSSLRIHWFLTTFTRYRTFLLVSVTGIQRTTAFKLQMVRGDSMQSFNGSETILATFPFLFHDSFCQDFSAHPLTAIYGKILMLYTVLDSNISLTSCYNLYCCICSYSPLRAINMGMNLKSCQFQ